MAVVVAQPGEALLTKELPGRLQAWRTAQVRARVEGIVEQRLFEEGLDVKVGMPLYRIVDDGYELPEARRVGRFVKALDLVRAGTYDDAFWTRLKATPFLVVDDLGTEPLDDKGWALANIAALIDARYDSTAKTVITTNLDAGQFKARYGASDGGRLVDRLRESAEFVQFDGASMRQSHG